MDFQKWGYLLSQLPPDSQKAKQNRIHSGMLVKFPQNIQKERVMGHPFYLITRKSYHIT